MQASRHSIFRGKALKHYAQSRKKDILPNFSSIPVAIFFWGLVASLLATGFLAAYIQVPVYLNAAGIVLGGGGQTLPGNSRAAALAFFQPNTSTKLRAGLPATIQVGASGLQLASTITEVEPGTSSPATILARYRVNISNLSLSREPAAIVFISLGANFPVALYAGSVAAITVQVERQALFSALTSL